MLKTKKVVVTKKAAKKAKKGGSRNIVANKLKAAKEAGRVTKAKAVDLDQAEADANEEFFADHEEREHDLDNEEADL